MLSFIDDDAVLTLEERDRYARQLTLPAIGERGQRQLKRARVLVVGAGGLGSPAALYLAAAGVGTLGIVDDDIVVESNLHRQVLHRTADVGRAKVDSAADAIAAANPLVKVRRHRTRLSADNALEIVTGYDLVLDGSDNFGTRYLVNDACVLAGKPWVWGSVLRFDGQVAVFWQGYGPTYRDLFPSPPGPGLVPSCGEAGVLGSVCAAVGAAMVTEAVKLLIGAGSSLLGKVAVHDALAMSWRTLRLAPDPRRTPTHEIFPEPGADDQEPSDDLPALNVSDLLARLQRREGGHEHFQLIDVREPEEHAAVCIPGSLLVPLGELLDRLDRFRTPEALIFYCAAGTRSAHAVRSFTASGRPNVAHLRGGIAAWQEHEASSTCAL